MFRLLPRPRWLWLLLLLLAAVALWLFTTGYTPVWALRNTLGYHAAGWWAANVGADEPAGSGSLRGCVQSAVGERLPDATVLVAEPDGTTHSTTSGPDGCYTLADIPAGDYVPVAGAPRQPLTSVRRWGGPLPIAAGNTRQLDIRLPPVSPPDVAPGTNLRISQPVTVSWELPEPGTAQRRELQFDSGGDPNQLTLYYTPVTATEQLPVLLAVYPGPANTWEGVSIPLAAAGYAVIAVGPAYSLDLEADIDELARLVTFARAGKLPHADGQRIALLGGSYSGLHVMALLQRDVGFRGAMLLGPPSDLFDLRRRFEAGSFFPPFGLDQAIIALGPPNTEPERYWRYSARYHLRPDLPPLALMHSRTDEVVPFQQTELLAAALDEAGADYDAYFFDGMSHYLLADRPSEDLDRLYGIALDFLARVMREP